MFELSPAFPGGSYSSRSPARAARSPSLIWPLERFHVSQNPVPVAVGLGRGEDHGLERDGCKCY